MQITDEMLYQHAAQARDMWLSALPQRDELPTFSCSNQFQRKMKRLLRQQRRSPRMNHLLRDMKRVVAVLLIAATITFAGLMTVEAYREKVIEVIKRVYNEFTQYEYSSTATDSVLPGIAFTYLPDGMELVSDVIYDNSVREVRYQDANSAYLTLDAVSVTSNSALTGAIDTEDAQIETLVLRGIEMDVIRKDDRYIICWEEGNVSITMRSNLPFYELKKIITEVSFESD